MLQVVLRTVLCEVAWQARDATERSDKDRKARASAAGARLTAEGQAPSGTGAGSKARTAQAPR